MGDLYLQTIARQAPLRVSALRSIVKFLDCRWTLLLYKAQIRPYLKYDALTWMSSAATHLRRLDRVEQGAMKLVDAATPQPSHEVSPLDIFYIFFLSSLPPHDG